MERFWLRQDRYAWREVTKAEYVRVERWAGFNNTLGQPDEPATAAWSAYGWSGTTLNPEVYEQ